MSSASPPDKKTEKKQGKKRGPGFFARCQARLVSLSLPARAAIVTAIVLLLLLLAVTLLFLLNPEHVPWRFSLTAGRIIGILVLVLVIPVVAYRGLRLWLEGDRSRFPEIDFAWRAGVEALRRGGISLDSAPLFLVLGSAGDEFEQSLFAAARINFRVRGVPEGPAPLHWYANPDRIFLVCSDAGWLSAVATLAARNAAPVANVESAGVIAPAPSAGLASPGSGTDLPISPSSRAAATYPAPSGGSGTVEIGQVRSSSSQPPGTTTAAHGGTVEIDQISLSRSLGSAEASAGAAQTDANGHDSHEQRGRPQSLPSAVTRPAVLATEDSEEQIQRLGHVCRHIQHARRPLCGINGLLTLISFASLRATQREHAELQKAIRADLAAVQWELRMRCPVTTLVVGMEQEPGFRELIRRVGRERAAAQRFGKGFDLRALPGREALAALCAHVSGSFEDWFYMLFREQGVLSHPGNRHLFSLLCKIRGSVKGRLAGALSNGYGTDSPHAAADDATYYSGCYFAATGRTPDRQAFVRGVFDKLEQEQEEVEWTTDALISQRRERRRTMLGLILCGLLLVVLLAMVLRTFLW